MNSPSTTPTTSSTTTRSPSTVVTGPVDAFLARTSSRSAGGRVEVKAWVDAVVAHPTVVDRDRRPDSYVFRGVHEGVYGVVRVRPTGVPASWYIATAYPQPFRVRWLS